MRRNIRTFKDMFALLGKVGVTFVVKKDGEEVKLFESKQVDLKQHLLNCSRISRYLISRLETLDVDALDIDEYAVITRVVDELYLYVKTVTREKEVSPEVVQKLRAQTLILKLGSKIPLSWMRANANSNFWNFIVRNYLQHDFFSLRLQLPFDYANGPSIPVYQEDLGLVWVPFQRIKIEKDEAGEKLNYSLDEKLLFSTDTNHFLGIEYACFYNGLQKYNIFTNPNWLPYDKRDPKAWKEKYLCQIWIFSKHESKGRPSLFHRTHAYMKLLDKYGHVRAVGQDVLVEFANYKVRELLSRKPGYGKIATPDKSVFYPTNSRRFWHVEIEITEEEHNKIIEIVQEDKKNKNHSMSVLRKNCVSYVIKLLDQALGLKVNARLNGIHVFFKTLMPDKWYRAFMRKFDPWYNRQKPFVQKAVYFFPPFYVLSLIAGILVQMTQSNNFQNEKKDLPFFESIVYPWKVAADHPLSFHRNLEKLADEDGVIHLERDQPS